MAYLASFHTASGIDLFTAWLRCSDETHVTHVRHTSGTWSDRPVYHIHVEGINIVKRFPNLAKLVTLGQPVHHPDVNGISSLATPFEKDRLNRWRAGGVVGGGLVKVSAASGGCARGA